MSEAKANEVSTGRVVINEPRCSPRKKPLLRHAVAAQGTQEVDGQRALSVPLLTFSPGDIRCCPVRVWHIGSLVYTHRVTCEPHHMPTQVLWVPKLGRHSAEHMEGGMLSLFQGAGTTVTKRRQSCAVGSRPQPGICSQMWKMSWGRSSPWKGFQHFPGLGWGCWQAPQI